MIKLDKYAFFAFRGDAMCFIHVLLNALDLHEKGHDVKIIMEGEAVKLIKELTEGSNPLYKKAVDAGLFDCVCKACSAKMGVLDYNEGSGIRISGEMSGHPPISKYASKGYRIITL